MRWTKLSPDDAFQENVYKMEESRTLASIDKEKLSAKSQWIFMMKDWFLH